MNDDQTDADQLDARMRESLGLHDANASLVATARDSFSVTPRAVKAPTRSEAATLAPDENETATWIAADAAATKVNELVEQIEALSGERRQAENTYRQAVADATRNGTTLPKPLKADDTDAKALMLAGQYQGLRDLYDQARRVHKAAAEAALPGQADRLLAAIPVRKEEAHKLLAAATALAEALRRWQHTVRVAGDTLHATGRKVPNVSRRQGSPDPWALERVLADVLAAFDSDDPAITGDHLIPDGLVPSRYEREEWFRSGGGALLELQMLEQRENFRHTSFTKSSTGPDSRRMPPTDEYLKLLQMSRRAAARR